jgi:hypothetical protein
MNKEEQKKLLIETMEADEKDGLYKQQTALEWLQEQLNLDMKTMQGHIIQDLLEQAKQMEKEQISKAWNDGDYAYFYSKETGREFENGEQYYNETYGK